MRLYISLLILILTFSSEIFGITLTLPSFPDGNHRYYHELLDRSFKNSGYDVTIKNIGQFPHKRILHMLDKGQISIYWLVQKNSRDKRWIPVRVGITNGLIGNRILFITRGTQKLFNNIKNLSDFRKSNLVGAFGKGWFDVGVWKYNKLAYYEVDGNWRNIYNMLKHGNRGIDYFSRGFNEIVQESKFNSSLDIEERVVLVYDRDYQFYLSKSAEQHRDLLEKVLMKSKKSGLMNKLIRKYWAVDFKKLKFDERLKIKLYAPK